MFDPEKLIRKGLPQGLLQGCLGARVARRHHLSDCRESRCCSSPKSSLTAPPPFSPRSFRSWTSSSLPPRTRRCTSSTTHRAPATSCPRRNTTIMSTAHQGDTIYNEQTFSYSGGGIAGPIVGTALLTVGSMILALFFGVSAAIYLAEYAQTKPVHPRGPAGHSQPGRASPRSSSACSASRCSCWPCRSSPPRHRTARC